MENTAVKLCIICGVENGPDKRGDCGPYFSKDLKLLKFCGELELSSSSSPGKPSLNLNGPPPEQFTAHHFLNQLEKCSNYVKICEKCSSLINETVDKRGILESVECEVLEMQIKLLIKLKEMEEVSKLYFGGMGRIKERVKSSQLNGLEKRFFEQEEMECLDLLGFSERILNVVTSQTIFQDNLNAKLCQDPWSRIPEEILESPRSPDRIPSMMEDDHDDTSNDFIDNLSLSSPPPLSPDLDDNRMEGPLEKIKMESGNPIECDPREQDNQGEDKVDIDKPKKDKPARINGRKLNQVNWKGMGPLKSILIRNVLRKEAARAESADDNILSTKYKWTYDIPTDQLKFADQIIEITEQENPSSDTGGQGGRRLILRCNDNHLQNDNHEGPFQRTANFPINWNLEQKSSGIYFLKGKIRDHVMGFHLKAFNCPDCPEGKEKFKTLRNFQRHLDMHRGGNGGNICEICGKSFSRGQTLRRHCDTIHARGNGGGGGGGVGGLKKFAGVDAGVGKKVKKKYQCSICGKVCADYRSCRRHEDTHKPMEERAKVICSFCGKEVLKKCYSMHKNNYCPGQAKVTSMTCEICGKVYKSGKNLGDHLVRTHRVKERPKFN